MRTRSKNPKAQKKHLIIDNKQQQYEQPETRLPFSDSQIQQSNSQLSQTLSTYFKPKQLICRQNEKTTISKFIRECLMTQASNGSRVLYISGVPGVGKTASTMQIVQKMQRSVTEQKAVFEYLNAMSIKNPANVYALINQKLFNGLKKQISKNPPLYLQQKLNSDKRVKFLIIDEIDFLQTKGQKVLYNLFEWSNLPSTKLCLIIIANTMDFPERLHPKLKSRMGTNRLVFKPYSYQEVQKIIQDRLMKSNRFDREAIIYGCKKMASFTSDVRKLLDVLLKTLENKKKGIITIDDISKCWKEVSQQNGDCWQEYLPDFYRQFLQIIKSHGGVSTNQKILQRLLIKQKYTNNQVLLTIQELSQMQIVKYKQKKQKGLVVYEVTLLKI